MANKINKYAFSVLEISIILLVLGIIIAGITRSSTILEKYRVYLAKKHTENSPVHSTPGLIAWYETTLESSFQEFEAQNFNDLSSSETNSGMGRISKWFDISGNNNHMVNLPTEYLEIQGAYKPKYQTDCVNNLPCLEFEGSTIMFLPKSAKLEGDYTAFIVEKKSPNHTETDEILLGSNEDFPASNSTLSITYSNLGALKYSHTNLNNSYLISNNILLKYIPILHSFTSNFKNELLPADKKLTHRFFDTNNESNFEDNGTPNILTISPDPEDYMIIGWIEGFGYKGQLLEIILFNRALKSRERKSVEEYLMKKWRLKYNPNDLFENPGVGGNQIISLKR